MAENESLVVESARRLFDQLADPGWLHGTVADWCEQKWRPLVEQGLPLALVREEDGGFGLPANEALAIIRVAGHAALPLPLGETMLAARILAANGVEVPDGPMTFASPMRTTAEAPDRSHGGRCAGVADAVPWARHAEWVIISSPSGLFALARGAFGLTKAETLAGEPSDSIAWDLPVDGKSVLRLETGMLDLELAGAAIRTLALAGAVERLLAMCSLYAQDRQQFGKPIAQFQAIQQHLAVLAGQAVICRAAADSAAEALFAKDRGHVVAMAKARASEAAGLAASIAHQIHGAIGFSDEYSLHLYTKRLWTWREEFGSDHHWNNVTGKVIVDEGAADIWTILTAQENAQ